MATCCNHIRAITSVAIGALLLAAGLHTFPVAMESISLAEGLSLIAPERQAATPDFSKEGPFGQRNLATMQASITAPLDNASTTLALTITAPSSSHSMHGEHLGSSNPFPLVLLFSGFQMPSSFYTAYASRIASWGYAVLQYDLPGFLLKKVIRDDKELTVVPELLRWVQQQVEQAGNPLYRAVDVQQLAVVGHSRGAKLAALMAAGQANVGAVVLIDPVDMTSATRHMGYPSAVEALRGLGKSSLLIGAGISGSCNPQAEGYRKFWGVLGEGSWQLVAFQAGHMQFTGASGAAGWVLDRICGAGGQSHQEAMALATTAAVAWLQASFRPSAETTAGLVTFESWVKERQASGMISFDVKGAPQLLWQSATTTVGA